MSHTRLDHFEHISSESNRLLTLDIVFLACDMIVPLYYVFYVPFEVVGQVIMLNGGWGNCGLVWHLMSYMKEGNIHDTWFSTPFLASLSASSFPRIFVWASTFLIVILWESLLLCIYDLCNL